MTDYIKIPTIPTQDLQRGIEALTPYARINPRQSRSESYSHQPYDNIEKRQYPEPRRFLILRRLIQLLQEAAQINRVDFATADDELRRLGLSIVEENLIPQLLQLKIPLDSIEQLLQQIDRGHSSVGLGCGLRINAAESILFPVSTEGLSEYNLKIDEVKIRPGQFDHKIVDQIDREGICIEQQNQLRLTFGRVGPALGTANELLKLKISVLLGVMEYDQDDHRAILYPRGDKNYGLYADKLINLSI